MFNQAPLTGWLCSGSADSHARPGAEGSDLGVEWRAGAEMRNGLDGAGLKAGAAASQLPLAKKISPLRCRYSTFRKCSIQGVSMRDKRERFIELAEKRVTRVIEQLRLIGNLANRNNYEYEADEASKIVAALEAEIRQIKSRFASEAGKRKRPFKL